MKNVAKAKADLEDRIRKLERKLNVVQKDRDHYRTINEMYEGEMTRIGGIPSINPLTIRIVYNCYNKFLFSSSYGVNGDKENCRT